MSWTYGAEHEFANLPRNEPLPKGYKWDTRDVTIVNSNGIANDPSGELYAFGGEVNTPPTRSIEGQVRCLQTLVARYPMAEVNYRSNLHIHIRVPGLKDDLKLLKQFQRYIHEHMPKAFPIIEPLPRPTVFEFPDSIELKGASRRWRRRRVSHQSLLSAKRLAHQLEARSVAEFFNWEPPRDKKGKPMWHAQPRLCVSSRQLLQTDTVEFRHFPGTLNTKELHNCLRWCREFMICALQDLPIKALLDWAHKQQWPPFPKYVHWQECCYRATVHDGTLTKDQIKQNIAKILEGTFDEGVGSLSRECEQIGAVRGSASGKSIFDC